MIAPPVLRPLFLALLSVASGSAETLTLERALELARDGQPAVRLARQDLSAVQARRDQALGALLPVVTASSDLSRLGPNAGGEGRSTAASRMDADAQWRTTLGARWTVFDGFRSWNALGSLSARERAARASELDALSASEEAAATRWTESWLAARKVASAREVLATTVVRSEVARRRLELGAEAGLEARQAALDASRDSLALLRAAAAHERSLRALAVALGLQPGSEIAVADALPLDTTAPTPGGAANPTPDVQALAALEDAARRELAASRGSWWPELSLYADYAWLGALRDEEPPVDAWSQGMVYGARASWVLFEGFRTGARAREAAAMLERAAVQRGAREREQAARLADTKRRWETALASWGLEARNEEQSALVLEAALARYRAGALSGLDLRRYQDSRSQARLDADEARAELVLSRMALRRALGVASGG
jgi:outer membrane protein TolC